MSSLWFNGSIAEPDHPVVLANDHGLVVGDGVFETLKVIDGKPFALTRHISRLQRSAIGLGIDLDIAYVYDGVSAVLGADIAPRSRLRITVTGGPGPYGSGRGTARPSILVATAPMSTWDATATVVVVPWVRNERSAVAGLKTISYAENVVALEWAHGRGASEAIFANTRGELCEGSGSNVFVAVGGDLVTPPLTSGCLAGVTRELVIEWLGDVVERHLPIEALASADEAFLASSTRDVHPIEFVDGNRLRHVPGPLTKRAMDVFAVKAKEDSDP